MLHYESMSVPAKAAGAGSVPSGGKACGIANVSDLPVQSADPEPTLQWRHDSEQKSEARRSASEPIEQRAVNR